MSLILFKGKRILVVDDEKALRRLFASVLEMKGYVVETVEDGITALQHMERHDWDLLITDYCMPRMNGLKLTKQVRSRFPSVPILVVTGDGPCDELVKNGATACVGKPFTSDELLEIVKTILDRDK
jgi:two-component system response regulator GlrR